MTLYTLLVKSVHWSYFELKMSTGHIPSQLSSMTWALNFLVAGWPLTIEMFATFQSNMDRQSEGEKWDNFQKSKILHLSMKVGLFLSFNCSTLGAFGVCIHSFKWGGIQALWFKRDMVAAIPFYLLAVFDHVAGEGNLRCLAYEARRDSHLCGVLVVYTNHQAAGWLQRLNPQFWRVPEKEQMWQRRASGNPLTKHYMCNSVMKRFYVFIFRFRKWEANYFLLYHCPEIRLFGESWAAWIFLLGQAGAHRSNTPQAWTGQRVWSLLSSLVEHPDEGRTAAIGSYRIAKSEWLQRETRLTFWTRLCKEQEGRKKKPA